MLDTLAALRRARSTVIDCVAVPNDGPMDKVVLRDPRTLLPTLQLVNVSEVQIVLSREVCPILPDKVFWNGTKFNPWMVMHEDPDAWRLLTQI